MTDRTEGWQAVHGFVRRLSAGLQAGPIPGSPEWIDLDDDDPQKLGGLIQCGSRWVLENEIDQIDHRRAAMKDAAVVVSTALPWVSIAKRIRDRDDFYKQHPDLRRRAS